MFLFLFLYNVFHSFSTSWGEGKKTGTNTVCLDIEIVVIFRHQKLQKQTKKKLNFDCFCWGFILKFIWNGLVVAVVAFVNFHYCCWCWYSICLQYLKCIVGTLNSCREMFVIKSQDDVDARMLLLIIMLCFLHWLWFFSVFFFAILAIQAAKNWQTVIGTPLKLLKLKPYLKALTLREACYAVNFGATHKVGLGSHILAIHHRFADENSVLEAFLESDNHARNNFLYPAFFK